VARWKVLFDAMENKYSGQCGWNIRGGESDAAGRFLLSLRAHEAMPEQQCALANEVRLATWPKSSGIRLPIRAFFYVPAASGALAKAQGDQRRYRDKYGLSVPILQLVLPVGVGMPIRFDYNPADQVAPM